MDMQGRDKKRLIGLLIIALSGLGCGERVGVSDSLESGATHTPGPTQSFSHFSHEGDAGLFDQDFSCSGQEDDLKDDLEDWEGETHPVEDDEDDGAAALPSRILASIPGLPYGGSAYRAACKALFNLPVAANRDVWRRLIWYGMRGSWRFSPYLFGVFAGSGQQLYAEGLLLGLCRESVCSTEDEGCMRDCVRSRGGDIANSLQGRYAPQAEFVRRISARLAQTYASASDSDGDKRRSPDPEVEQAVAFAAMRAGKERIFGSSTRNTSTRRNTFETCMTHLQHVLEGKGNENEAGQCFSILKRSVYSRGFTGIEEKWSRHVVEEFLARGNSAYAQQAFEVLCLLDTQHARAQQERLLREHVQLRRMDD